MSKSRYFFEMYMITATFPACAGGVIVAIDYSFAKNLLIMNESKREVAFPLIECPLYFGYDVSRVLLHGSWGFIKGGVVWGVYPISIPVYFLLKDDKKNGDVTYCDESGKLVIEEGTSVISKIKRLIKH